MNSEITSSAHRSGETTAHLLLYRHLLSQQHLCVCMLLLSARMNDRVLGSECDHSWQEQRITLILSLSPSLPHRTQHNVWKKGRKPHTHAQNQVHAHSRSLTLSHSHIHKTHRPSHSTGENGKSLTNYLQSTHHHHHHLSSAPLEKCSEGIHFKDSFLLAFHVTWSRLLTEFFCRTLSSLPIKHHWGIFFCFVLVLQTNGKSKKKY